MDRVPSCQCCDGQASSMNDHRVPDPTPTTTTFLCFLVACVDVSVFRGLASDSATAALQKEQSVAVARSVAVRKNACCNIGRMTLISMYCRLQRCRAPPLLNLHRSLRNYDRPDVRHTMSCPQHLVHCVTRRRRSSSDVCASAARHVLPLVVHYVIYNPTS